MNRLLSISLIPKSTWYNNVRSQVSRDVWNAIRAYFKKPSCQFCGYKGKLFTHEVWKYDDALHIQKLVGFESVCFLCHSIKHLGLAGIQAQQGYLDYSELIEHYCAVNECTKEDFLADREEAFELWKERSKFEWIVDVSYLDSLDLPKRRTSENTRKVRAWMREHPDEVARLRNSYSDVLTKWNTFVG